MMLIQRKISLRQQAAAADDELEYRRRTYPIRVKTKTMTTAEAEHGIAVMTAIRDTLRLFADFEPQVRETVRREITRRKLAVDAEQSAAVQALKNEFPDARHSVRLPEDDEP